MYLLVNNLIGSFTAEFITRENITLIIAVWGAALSTYMVISDYRKNVRSIKVEVSYGFLTRGNKVGSNLLNITAVNTGYRDITLSSVGFILNDESQLIILNPQGDVKFPHTLKGGKSCIIYKEQSNLAQQLKKNGLSGNVTIKGYYISATGKIYKSKPIQFNIEAVE